MSPVPTQPSSSAALLDASDRSTRFVLPAESPLLANMAALWSTDPGLAAEIELCLDQPPYDVESTRAGAPTLALPAGADRRLYLHSRHQPLDEARRLIETADVEEKGMICVLGFGLGYHVELIFDRVGDDGLMLILEPDLRLLRTAFSHRDFSRLILSGRMIFLTRPDRASVLLKLTPFQAMITVGVAFVTHAPSVQIAGGFHTAMQSAISDFVAYCRTSLNTLIINGRRTAENIARNIAWYVASPGIGDLRQRHAGQPAIIVSAGPSLRKNKHLLRDAAGRAVIIAVPTTLQPLLDMGVTPDYVTALDYHEICAMFFEKLPAFLPTRLVAEPKANRVILSGFPGPVSVLGNEFAERLIRELHPGKPTLRPGATVAHLAFYLAEHLGCDPIIFVGQDLGFADGLAYAPGTSHEDVWRPELGRFCTLEMKHWEYIARERPILRRIEDGQGRPMYTEERLYAYLQQFERDFATTRARIIDATEGGARKRGAEAMALKDALARFCDDELPAAPHGCPPCRWDLLGGCIDSLRVRRKEAGQIRAIAGETLPLLEQVSQCLEDPHRANPIIARIDALRSRMAGLNQCYDLVTQLTQHTEMVRFQSDRRLAASKATGVERQKRQVARDILNVRAIADAAAQFEKLMDEVIETVIAQAAGHSAQ